MLHQKLSGLPAELPGCGSRHLACVHRIEVPARGQHVRPPARGRAGGARRHEAAVEGGEQAGGFGIRARIQRRADGLFHLAQHGGAGVPLGRQAISAGDQAGGQGLQAFHRVSRAAPGGAVGEGLGARATPGFAERGGERVDAEGEIVAERAQEGSLTCAGSAHAPRDRAQELDAALRRGRLAEDMEAVAYLHLLDFAEITVELAERVVAAVGGPDAAILVEPGRRGKLQDARAQGRTAARIDRGGVEELVHQPLQLLQRAVAAGAG